MKTGHPKAAAPGWVVILAVLALIVVGRYALIAVLDSGPPIGDVGNEARRAPAADSTYDDPKIVGRLQVPALTELSGLAASLRNPGLLWAHNDSGDGPFVYCIETSGAGCGIWRVDGAEAVDWEDIAAAPDERGIPALYIADIGDNARSRATVTVYRVPEPHVATSQDSRTPTLNSEAFTFTYPDRAHDAEAILVNRTTGDLYVITKDYSSRSVVFVARAPLVDRAELERVTSIKIEGLLTDRTGASLSPNGKRIVFSTYAGGYELRLPHGAHFDRIWGQEPIPIDLGPHEQGEAVTYDVSGTTIISASEGARSAIYAVSRRD
ncbi:MAG: hypothetical protein KY391_00350 [Actinobacteria bacterium]|nr:hypothetical protein [Actinomycetota bacterium]